MLEHHIYGEGNSPTLILIHRGGMLHRMWEPQLEPLAEHFRVIAPDLYYPGAWDEFSIQRAADDVRALATDLTDGPAIYAGVALGAVVAMQLAADAPETVRGLVLAAPRVRVPVGAFRFNRWLMRLLPRKMVETSHVKQQRRVYAETSEEAEQEMYRLGRPGLMAASRAMEGINFSDILPTYRMPIRVLIGQYGTEKSREAATVVARRAPHAELHLIEDAGTWLNLDQPAAFTQAIVDFADTLGENQP